MMTFLAIFFVILIAWIVVGGIRAYQLFGETPKYEYPFDAFIVAPVALILICVILIYDFFTGYKDLEN